jgi:hypothetical protein
VSDHIERFDNFLREAAGELFADNPDRMRSGQLLESSNVIDAGDVALFWLGVNRGLITLHRGARFNTRDRPKEGGRWSLLSRAVHGGWCNAEYLPQIAAYVDAIVNLGYAAERVLFELPGSALQLGLAILDDEGQVVVLGEAKRDIRMLGKLRAQVLQRFADALPSEETKKRGDEARQLAWRLWTVAPAYTWLIAPGQRDAYQSSISPLTLHPVGVLPRADEVGLALQPARQPPPPAII